MSEPQSRFPCCVSEEDVDRTKKAEILLAHNRSAEAHPTRSGENVCGTPPQTTLKPMIGELENRQTERFL
jgi:hypothetical protein